VWKLRLSWKLLLAVSKSLDSYPVGHGVCKGVEPPSDIGDVSIHKC
jgi:hypothetical protein